MNEKGNSERPLECKGLRNLIECSRSNGGKWSFGLIKDTLLEIPGIDREIQNGNSYNLFLVGELLRTTKEGSQEAVWTSRWLDRYSDKLDLDGNQEHLVIVLQNIRKTGTDLTLKALNYIDQNAELVELRSEGNKWLSRAYWQYRLDEANVEIINGKQNGINLSRLKTVWGNDDIYRNEVVKNVLFDHRSVDKQTTYMQISTLLVSMGIDEKISKDLAKSWMTYNWKNEEKEIYFKDRFVQLCNQNIDVIVGISKELGFESIIKLYREYGITHFGRYTVEMLKQQLKVEGSDVPYGIAMSAYADWNGALSNVNSLEKRESLLKSADGLGYKIKFVEARNKVTVVRRVKELARKFPRNKIAFKYLEGHGSPNRVQMGELNVEDSFLTTSDLKKETAGKMKQFYTDSCPTLFDSCSTGLGIGPAYSEYGSSYSMAPDRPASIRWVELKKDLEGILFFKGEYYPDQNKVPTITILSFNGENASEKIKVDEKIMHEIRYQEMITSQEGLEVVWSDSSILLGVLKREKLDPLKKLLREKYGDGKLSLESHWDDPESEDNEGSLKIDLDLMEDTTFSDWGTGFLEGLGSECRYVYIHRKDEKPNYWPEIRVIGKNDEVIDSYKIDMSDLWPENLKK